jgi:uncharacterized protein YqjF (DUF2071 family)
VKPFLTAEWRMLAMLNWRVDRSVVAPYVPRGTELDFHDGHTFVSVVGFLFRDTRLLGLGVPFHRTFEEVNLRLYVRRGDRRAVVFVREVVPRGAIAAVARLAYNEPYVALPMRHRIGVTEAAYGWRSGGKWMEVFVRSQGEAAPLEPGSHEEFIAEHYWGYCAQRDGGTLEYRVEHPPWRAWRATEAALSPEAADFYPPEFAATLSRPPDTAFLADGSAITVYRPNRIA